MKHAAILVGLAATMAGCSSDEEAAPAVAQGDEQIACAVSGAQEFSEVCAVDRVQADGTMILIVRHPDGAFRRFEVVKDGRGLIAADGAEPAKTEIAGDKLSVSIADHRYLFPAKIQSSPTHEKP